MLEMNMDWRYGDFYITYEGIDNPGMNNTQSLRDYNGNLHSTIKDDSVFLYLGENDKRFLDDIKNAPHAKKLLYFYSDGGDIPCYDKMEKEDGFLYILQNKNCKNCENCYGCIDCESCDDCLACTACTACTECGDCMSCVACIDCDDCVSCMSCRDCNHCEDCTRCGNCKYCEGRIKCHGIEE